MRVFSIMSNILKLNMNLGITKEDLFIDDLLFNPYSYQQESVKAIISEDICINLLNVSDLTRHVDKTIKIENMEKLSEKLYRLCRQVADKLSHDGPVTCHLFLAPPGSISFARHTDPDNVLIYVVDGEKVIKLDNEEVTLTPGAALFMQHGTPHQAINNKYSIMLSFGLERYILEKL